MQKLAIMLLLLCAAGLHADALEVGQDAPKFKAAGTLINPPEYARNRDDCKGDVILIYEWQARDGTTGGLPAIQQYWDKHGGQGLQVFTIHRLNFEKWPKVEAYCRANKYTFPVAMGGFYDDANDFQGYRDGPSFHTTVVGVDGKVAYYGKDDGWKAVLDAELEKEIYPNLGKQEVAKAAKDAAEQFAKRDFGKAITTAEKLLAGDKDEATKSDAQLVIDKATGIADKRNARIKEWLEDRRYDLATRYLEYIKHEFKGHAIGDEAAAKLTELKKDKQAKTELKAFAVLDKVIDKYGGDAPDAFAKALHDFAATQPEARAGTLAESMAKKLDAALKE